MGTFTYTRQQKKEIKEQNKFWLCSSGLMVMVGLILGVVFIKNCRYLESILWFYYSGICFSYMTYNLIRTESFKTENKILHGMEELHYRIKNLKEENEEQKKLLNKVFKK